MTTSDLSVALVTGASKGIGLAEARVMAEEGCHVHLAARTRGDLEHEAARIRADFGPLDWSAPGRPPAHGFLLSRHGLYTWGRDLAEARRHIEIHEFLFEVVARSRTLSPARQA